MSGQYELIVNPDVEAGIVALLESEPRITAFTPAAIISASTVGYQVENTWVHVYRAGGVSQYPMPDVASMYFNVLSPDRKTARKLSALVLGVLHSNLGSTVGDPGEGMRITNVVNMAGLAWLPDPSGLPRYTFSVQITARPF